MLCRLFLSVWIILNPCYWNIDVIFDPENKLFIPAGTVCQLGIMQLYGHMKRNSP